MKIIEEKINWKPYSVFRKNNPAVAIIHHAISKNCTIHDINNWHLQKGWNGCGYHYFIDKKGNVYKGRLHEWEGAHCLGKNFTSLSICLEGCYTDYKNITEKTVPETQINSLVDLLIYLNKPFKYHRDYTNEKDCPGKYFLKQDELQELLNGKKKVNTVEQWKLDEVIKAVKYGYIDNDAWKNKINDSIPVWAVLEMINDTHEKYDKIIEILSNRIIKALEELDNKT